MTGVQTCALPICAPGDFKDTGFSNPATPYLGGMATTADGLVQRLDVQRLLPPATRAMLFAPA